MKTYKLLSVLCGVLLLLPFSTVQADRPSLTSLQQQINQLNARVNDLEQTTQSLSSSVFDLQNTTAELNQLVDPLREVCGGNETKLSPENLFGPVRVLFRGNPSNWLGNAGGDASWLGDAKGYPCYSDVALNSYIDNGIDKVAADGLTVAVGGTNLPIAEIYMGDLVVEKIQHSKDPTKLAPGKTVLGKLVLIIPGVNFPSYMGSWWSDVLKGTAGNRDVLVEGHGFKNPEAVIASYQYSNCLPVGYELQNLSAYGSLSEMITIACDSVVMTLPQEYTILVNWLNEVQTNPTLEPTVEVEYLHPTVGSLVYTRIFEESFPTRYVFPRRTGTENLAAHQFHFRANGLIYKQ